MAKRTKTASDRELSHRIIIWVTVIIIAGFAASMAFIAFMHFRGISFFLIQGNSMHPTLSHGDTLVLEKEAAVNRDSLFLFDKPAAWGYMGDDAHMLVKRTTAVVGDTLTYDDGVFMVNDEVVFDTVAEDYACEPGVDKYSHQLTNLEIFVTGDNAAESLDSRRIFCDGDLDNFLVTPEDRVDHGTILTVF